jgi:hypothetical protein
VIFPLEQVKVFIQERLREPCLLRLASELSDDACHGFVTLASLIRSASWLSSAMASPVSLVAMTDTNVDDDTVIAAARASSFRRCSVE